MGRGGPQEICDTWVALAAMATATTRVRLGTLLTALARYRPWEVALRTVSLDRLTQGRVTLTVGIGAKDAFERLGEDTNRAGRIGRTVEAVQIITSLWTGEPTTFEGNYYGVTDLVLRPTPIQKPRPPLWVRAWNQVDAVVFAAQWDGIHVPSVSPERLRRIAEQMPGGTDVVVEAPVQARTPRADVAPFEEAGATWWLEQVLWLNEPSPTPEGEQAMLERVREGPPE